MIHDLMGSRPFSRSRATRTGLCIAILASLIPHHSTHAIELRETAQLGEPTTIIALTPGGNETIQGAGFSNFGEDQETRQGTTASRKTEGTTAGGQAPVAIAKAEASIIQENAARFFTADARATLVYNIAVFAEDGSIPGFGVPVEIYGSISSYESSPKLEGALDGSSTEGFIRVDGPDGNAYTRTDSFISLEDRLNGTLNNFRGDLFMTPNENYTITLTAIAQVTVRSGAFGLKSGTAESIVDPQFEFDQAAYEQMRLADPSLPDIVLEDFFFLATGPGLIPEPATVSCLMLAGLLLRQRT